MGRTVLGLLVVVCMISAVVGQNMYYSYNGTGNNVQNPMWGANGQALLRLGGYDYEDGSSVPRGDGRLVSPRVVSNAVHDLLQIGTPLSSRDVSDYLTFWGQWVDHDIDVSAVDCAEMYPIPIPAFDPTFNPTNATDLTLPVCRSTYINGSDPRDQTNDITAWLDGSVVYGHTQEWADALRTMSDGKLKSQMIGGEEFPPYNEDLFPMANGAGRVAMDELFFCGDKRANENPILLALHVLFVREHNRLADEIASEQGLTDDEEIYQQTRKYVTGFIQSITYNEYLPNLFGEPIADYGGAYDDTVNPGIDAMFSGATFRYGHSEVKPVIRRLDEEWTEHSTGDILLMRGYFFPAATVTSGADAILRGAAVSKQQEVDGFITGAMRNNLFGLHTHAGAPGAAQDLFALNIQRGREHGMIGYNDARVALGLTACGSSNFDCVTPDSDLAAALASVYPTTDDIDIFVGGLAEAHVKGNLGELFAASLEEQFNRLRAGDRFYYEHWTGFTDEERDMIHTTTLSDLIRRNTAIPDMPSDVFKVFTLIDPDTCPMIDSEEDDPSDETCAGTTVNIWL